MKTFILENIHKEEVRKQFEMLGVTPRNSKRTFLGGWGNGYVILDKEHPLYGKHYMEIEGISVHGGLTFSNYISESMIKSWDIPEEYKGMYMIGFDTFHAGDTEEYWTKERVQEEADNLLEQCKSMLQ